MFDVEGRQKCIDCGLFQELSAFYPNGNVRQNGRFGYCIACHCVRTRTAAEENPREQIRRRLKAAKVRTRIKNALRLREQQRDDGVEEGVSGAPSPPSRPLLPECNLTFEHLEEAWRAASGRCHYSGVP